MKTVKNFAILVAFIAILSSVLLVSCSFGEVEQGTVWHYGDEEPGDAIVARIGDFYMNTDSGDVFVLEEGGWKNLANVNGKDGVDGVDGKDGATWLSGKGAPTASDGADGDFWLDTDTLKMYKKESGAWSVIADFNK